MYQNHTQPAEMCHRQHSLPTHLGTTAWKWISLNLCMAQTAAHLHPLCCTEQEANEAQNGGERNKSKRLLEQAILADGFAMGGTNSSAFRNLIRHEALYRGQNLSNVIHAVVNTLIEQLILELEQKMPAAPVEKVGEVDEVARKKEEKGGWKVISRRKRRWVHLACSWQRCVALDAETVIGSSRSFGACACMA